MHRSAMRELAFKMVYGLQFQKDDNNLEQVDIFIENNDIEEGSV